MQLLHCTSLVRTKYKYSRESCRYQAQLQSGLPRSQGWQTFEGKTAFTLGPKGRGEFYGRFTAKMRSPADIFGPRGSANTRYQPDMRSQFVRVKWGPICNMAIGSYISCITIYVLPRRRGEEN